MTYTAKKPPLPETIDELRTRIPGWGVDLDPADRPSVPRIRFDLSSGDAAWEIPERQAELRPRERSIEHSELTPVFGTSTPLKGWSGIIRRYSYRRFSEARAAHWLLLLAGDRVDALEEHLRALVTVRPDNPIMESGVVSEFRSHGFTSRIGSKRVDARHQWLDPFVVVGPWVGVAGAAYFAWRTLLHWWFRRPT